MLIQVLQWFSDVHKRCSWHWGALVSPLMLWKSNLLHIRSVCSLNVRRMRRVSSLACPAVLNFYTLSHKRHDFRKKKVLNKKWVFRFSLQLLFETFLNLTRTSEIWSEVCIGVSVKYPSFLFDFNGTWFFLDIFSKNTHIIFNGNPFRGNRIVHADVRTDRHGEANSYFSKFLRTRLKITTLFAEAVVLWKASVATFLWRPVQCVKRISYLCHVPVVSWICCIVLKWIWSVN